MIRIVLIIMIAIIAMAAIVLVFSEPVTTLAPSKWYFTFLWTKTLGIGLFVFLYHSTKWMIRYSDKQ